MSPGSSPQRSPAVAPAGIPRAGAAEADVKIGLDLARHRALCVAELAGRQSIIPLAPEHSGLVLRWIDRRGTRHRITDRILDAAGLNDAADLNDADLSDPGLNDAGAVEVMTAVASCVFPEPLPTVPVIAVPSAFGPACRRAVRRGFANAGITLPPGSLIDRPIAALALWLKGRSRLGNPPPAGPMVVIDNDGGQLSVCAVDTDARRIVFSAPLSAGPDDDPAEITERFAAMVIALDRLRAVHPMVRPGDWSAISGSIGQILVSGTMAEHPQFLNLLARVLPAAAVVRDPLVPRFGEVVAFGLLNLDALTGWSAGWPTLSITLDDQVSPSRVIRPAGASPEFEGDDVAIVVGANAELGFCDDDGVVVPIQVGGVQAEAIALPRDLGPVVTLRCLNDGRVLVLGPEGVRPLSFRVAWPVTGAADAVALNAIGRRPLQLIRPRVDRPHRATAA